MEETTELKMPEPKLDIDNDKENPKSKKFPHDKNDSFKVPVDIKSITQQYRDEENEEGEIANVHIEVSVKNIFIRKVFGILAIKFLLFYSFVLTLHLKDSIRRDIIDNYDVAEDILFYASIAFGILFLILLFSRKVLKIVPYNYIFFFAISLSEIASFSVISSLYYFHIVSISLFMTFIAPLIIVIYSLIEKEDYSYLKLGLLVFFGQLLVIWFVSVFYEIKVLYILFSFITMIALGNFFAYDTLSIADKLGKLYSDEDYVFVTLEIYIDAVKTVLMLLKNGCQALCKKCRRKKVYNKI